MISKIAAGYGQLLKKWGSVIVTILKTALFFVMIFGLSLLIVYPLWFFATNNSDLYTSTVIILSLICIISFIIYRVINSIRISEFSFGSLVLKRVVSIFRIFGFILLLLLIVYIFSRTLFGGIISLIISLFIYGVVKFVIKK